MKNIKKKVKKRIKIWKDDKWDTPSGDTRKGERHYRKEGDLK